MRFFAVAVTAAAAFNPMHELFAKYKAEFKKEYKSVEEEAKRLEIFVKNVMFIQEQNAKQSSFKLEVNEFADMSREEFRTQRFGVKMPAKTAKVLGVHRYSGAELADSVDWTTKGAVTPVKNQGQCGSCWSFSTTGALEGANFVSTGKLVSLSEQEFVDCDTVDQGCNGGLMDNAFKFAESNAICTEESYPYTATGGSCQQSSCTVGLAQGAVTGYTDVDQSEQALMEAVTKQPVAIAIEADQQAFQFYTSGVLTAECGTNLDHGVLLVGYGTENGQDYWKVKNSWGASWGDQGYIKLARGVSQQGGQCGILMSASYPTVAAAADVVV